MIGKFEISDNGDSAITIFFEQTISEDLSKKIIQLSQQIKHQLKNLVVEVIPAYQSLTIIYDLRFIQSQKIKLNVIEIIASPLPELKINSKLITIPVCYEDEFAPDMDYLAKHCDLTKKQLVALHTQPTYLIHMLGFLPGFLYLSGLDERLFCPRKGTPLTRIPAGSIAIGGEQTGIYPISSPGGWQLIGTTPLKLFNPQSNNPFVATALDKIKFVAITKTEFKELSS